MFNNFLEFFKQEETFPEFETPYNTFINQFSGKQFGEGLFNILKKEDIEVWSENVYRAYPELNIDVDIFAYDWLGNCFGLCKTSDGKEEVYLFEIGTGEILMVSSSFEDFIDNEIPNNTNTCLVADVYREWVDLTNVVVTYGKCIGYKIPLFLGGEDTLENLEESDMSVYWEILSQVLRKV